MLTLSITRSRPIQFLSAFLLALAFLTPSVFGQVSVTSPDASKSELQKLRDELKTKDARIKQLEAEVASLRAQLGTTSQSGAPTSSPAVTIDESVPSSSPRALFNALKTSYAEATKDLELGTNENDKSRIIYMKKIQAWQEKVNREFRTPVTWTVQVQDHALRDGRYVTRFLAVDPQTHAPLGEPFTLALGHPLGDKIDAWTSQGNLDVLELKGVLVPRVDINADRTVAGAFDSPPFIGPFAEYNFTIDVQSLVKPRESTENPPPHGTDLPRKPQKP